MRRTARRLPLLLLALAALLPLGCGDGADATRAEGAEGLVVSRYRGERLLDRRELDCGGADRALCDRIAAALPALAPEPDEVCTELYGGPERITLTGRLGGADVRRELTRTNGCEIARYDRLAALLG